MDVETIIINKMKKLITVIACLIVGQACKAQFEGTFTMNVMNDKRPEGVTVNYTVKGQKILTVMTVNGNTFKTMIDNVAGTSTMLMDQGGAKRGIRSRIPPQLASQTSQSETPTITETNEKRDIQGYSCRKVIVENAESKVDFWITDQILPGFARAIEALSNTNQARMMAGTKPLGYENIKGSALEYVITTKKTGALTTVKFENIKQEKIDDTVFDISGYEIMEMPVMDMMHTPGTPPSGGAEKK